MWPLSGAAVMTGAELAERQQGLVAQKVIAGARGRPAAGPRPRRLHQRLTSP